MVDVTGPRTSRRAVLAVGAGAVLGTAVPAAGEARASAAPEGGVARRLRGLEREHAAKLGVFAYDTATGRTVRHRANDLFPICSVFKTIAVAAVLRDLDHDGEFLARRIRYGERCVAESGYAPITGKPENLARGMTVEALCGAAVSHSDNAAANLLLRELGGPTAVTRFCRSVGDRTTRLDRWEPELNSAEPWRRTDTTSPRAIARTYERLVLGDALDRADRRRLTGWLLASTTSGDRFRAGLPDGWTVADKTGGGAAYGVANDVGIAWPPGRPPIVMAVLTRKAEPDAASDDLLVARTAALLASALG